MGPPIRPFRREDSASEGGEGKGWKAGRKQSSQVTVPRTQAAIAMPTVLRAGPYRLYWFSHDAVEPPHIHVDRDARSLKIWLNSVAVARNDGFGPTETGRILALVRAHRSWLLEEWHGKRGRGKR